MRVHERKGKSLGRLHKPEVIAGPKQQLDCKKCIQNAGLTNIQGEETAGLCFYLIGLRHTKSDFNYVLHRLIQLVF